MAEEHSIKVIARIRSDFSDKFGIPRQSGIVDALTARVVFEPEFRRADALRGIEEFSHLWIVWQFSQAVRSDWSPTVRPPRLGGNERMGVFATRSPFRPNSIGLSSVRLERVEDDPKLGRVLVISGADMLDGTPVYDVKPYLPYTDSHPDALGGFASGTWERELEVVFGDGLAQRVAPDKLAALTGVLKNDPRPSYQSDPERVYGMDFAGMNIKFKVAGGVLTVIDIA